MPMVISVNKEEELGGGEATSRRAKQSKAKKGLDRYIQGIYVSFVLMCD